MVSSLRHVHTVRLTAPDETLIRRGAILLEDALHTASIPGDVGGRVLVVRSLQVGTIHSHQSSASLALTIEQHLQQLSTIAVHAAHSTAASHPAVYFHDAIEPYVMLIMRLVRHQPISEWFWSSVVPEYCPDYQPLQTQNRCLLPLLTGLLQTSNGVVRVSHLLQELQSNHGLDSLLSVLSLQDGLPLLAHCGWARSVQSSGSEVDSNPMLDRSSTQGPVPQAIALPQLSPLWHATLRRWISHWGDNDARSLWLTAMALVAQKPARLLEVQFMSRVRAVVAAVPSPAFDRLDSGDGQLAIAPASGESASPEPRSGSLDAPPEPTTEPTAADPAWVPQQHNTSQPTSSNHSFADTSADTFADTFTDTFANTSTDTSAEEALPAVPPLWLLDTVSPTDLLPGTPYPTAYAGLFFLLPLMTRLGLTPFLETHPDLIELEFPVRLLHQLGDRLSIPANDPSRLALPAIAPVVCPFPAFILPDAAWNLAHSPCWRVCPTADGHTLWDGSGRFPLAFWREDCPAAVRDRLNGAPIHYTAERSLTTPWQILLQGWLIALRRWCRRYAQMGLPALVGRPGRLVASRTHIDVLFHHHQADLRLRQAGLDLDPGWLPWLGRVVLFHYLNGE